MVAFTTNKLLMVEEAEFTKRKPVLVIEKRPVVVALVVVAFTMVRFPMVELAVFTTIAELIVSESANASPIVASP